MPLTICTSVGLDGADFHMLKSDFKGYVCPFLAWPEVVVPSCFWVRPHGLHRVCTAIQKQRLVVLDDLWARLQSHGHKQSPPFVPSR